MPIQVKELAFVFHPVTDIARARQFYEGVLSLKTGVQFEFSPGQWWVEYDIAGQALAISNAMPGTKSESLVLEVVSLDEAVETLAAANIPLLGGKVMKFPSCRMCRIADPDGNEIGLHQRKAKA